MSKGMPIIDVNLNADGIIPEAIEAIQKIDGVFAAQFNKYNGSKEIVVTCSTPDVRDHVNAELQKLPHVKSVRSRGIF